MSNQSHLSEPQLNATPLIDVLLVLIVILIITLPIGTHAVKVNLPQGRATAPPPAIRLDLYSEGEIAWDGERIASVEQLVPRFLRVAQQADPPLIKVIPEKRTRYELVAQVLAAAQRSRVTSLSVVPIADP